MINCSGGESVAGCLPHSHPLHRVTGEHFLMMIMTVVTMMIVMMIIVMMMIAMMITMMMRCRKLFATLTATL